jgi:hypothetical protein
MTYHPMYTTEPRQFWTGLLYAGILRRIALFRGLGYSQRGPVEYPAIVGWKLSYILPDFPCQDRDPHL